MTEQQDSSDDYNRDSLGRFGPGNQGGPGRRPGTKVPSFKAALERAVLESIKGDGMDARSVLDAMAVVGLQMARDGDFKFWREIMDRLDGPVTQRLETDQVVRVDRVPTRALEEAQDAPGGEALEGDVQALPGDSSEPGGLEDDQATPG